jgi:hypothetical protein
MLKLFFKEIIDNYVRENFKRLEAYLMSQAILSGNWRFVEITFAAAVTNSKYKHNLNFTPRDVIQTSKTGAGTLTWNYSLFDETNLDITTTDACVVRAFIGKYDN